MSFAKTLTIALFLSLAISGCQRAPQSPANAPAGNGAFAVNSWPLPSSPGAAQPNLIATADGRVLLSWISSVPGRRNALQFVVLGDNAHWQSPPRTIVVGDSLVTDWADTPHIAATADGALWVQWLQNPASGGAAADVMLSRSHDGGFNWSSPVRVNAAGNAGERGFAALWPQSRDGIGIAWLDGNAPVVDGRAEAVPSHAMSADTHASESGATTGLRVATFDSALRRASEDELDTMTCDCCQTSVAITADGPVLAYRDRSAQEIRDISVVRFDKSAWSPPETVHADNWTMSACPVNGPAISARQNQVLVGWYTGANDTPAVKLARSSDAGVSFDAPVAVEAGTAVQGRVAVALDTQQAWVLWVREDAGGQTLWLARFAPDLTRELQRLQVAKLQGRGRGTGFPQLAVQDGAAYLVWTDISEGAPQLHGAIVAAK